MLRACELTGKRQGSKSSVAEFTHDYEGLCKYASRIWDLYTILIGEEEREKSVMENDF